MDVMNLVENRETSEFYPTPESLIRKMLGKVDWKTVQTVLEPSAGKGDILREIARKVKALDRREFEVDAIEIDPHLRSILKYSFSEEAEEAVRDRKEKIMRSRGRYAERDWSTHQYRYQDDKDRQYHWFPDDEQEQLASFDYELDGFFAKGIHVVHDDFLTYTPYKQYNLIIMNPPFSKGELHLLHAIRMQKHGGQIVCLLNAETIRNPFTAARTNLEHYLQQYDAKVEFLQNEFVSAERRTGVEVALVYINIPYADNDKASIYERMAKAKEYKEPTAEEAMELEVVDFIQAIVNRYKVEVESGIELIRTYRRMIPYLRSSVNSDDKYARPLICLTDGVGYGSTHEVTVNSYVKDVRRKYWQALLTNDKFIGKLTAKLQSEYRERVNGYADYDFSEFNIYTLLVEMNSQIKAGIEDEIMKMYDRLTEEHAYYPECKKNRHLYDGWKTNKAWKLSKKSIIPCYGVFSAYDGKPRVYEALSTLSDIERILNFFDGNTTAEVNLSRQLEMCFANGVTKNIDCKFFTVTFYKKGTVHITFTCPELIDRFNIYAAQNKCWLPPCYGKKQYADMTADEQAVIDSFQGKEAYAEVMRRADYYLASPVAKTDMLLLDMSSSENEQRTA